MIDIAVCVGSTCHVKGTKQVFEQLKNLISLNRLSGKVSLRGTFCMGNCQQGVSVTVDGVAHSVQPESVNAFFTKEILSKIHK